MRRRADQRGFTLIEVLVAMTLSLIVLTATLAIFNTAYQESHDTSARNDTTEQARNSLETLARQLRNLALRINNVAVINKMASTDFIFQTSDPSRTWVRYCLDSSAPGAINNARLWEADSATSLLTAGMTGSCPGTGWSTALVVGQHVTNLSGNRKVFTYKCAPSAGAACPASIADADRVLSVNASLYINMTPANSKRELRLSTGVYLRNQNQAPVAQFTVAATSTARRMLLNGSGSSDFEGRTLTYYWFKGTAPSSIDCSKPRITLNASNQQFMWNATYLGEGVSLSYAFPATDGASKPITLVVCDPGARYGTDGPRTVTIQ